MDVISYFATPPYLIARKLYRRTAKLNNSHVLIVGAVDLALLLDIFGRECLKITLCDNETSISPTATPDSARTSSIGHAKTASAWHFE